MLLLKCHVFLYGFIHKDLVLLLQNDRSIPGTVFKNQDIESSDILSNVLVRTQAELSRNEEIGITYGN